MAEPGPGTPCVAVVIAARNEAATVGATVSGCLSQLRDLGIDHVVLVMDDGSRDGTTDAARTAGARTVTLPPRGQGAALRAGYDAALAAGATVVVSMDADGQHRPEDLPALLRPVLVGDVTVATGSRVLGAAEGTVAVRAAGIRFFAALLSLLAHRRVSDPSCGFRAMSRAALSELDLRAAQFHTAEVLGQAYGLRLAVAEVPVTIVARTVGVSQKPPTLRYALGFGSVLVRNFAGGRRRRP